MPPALSLEDWFRDNLTTPVSVAFWSLCKKWIQNNLLQSFAPLHHPTNESPLLYILPLKFNPTNHCISYSSSPLIMHPPNALPTTASLQTTHNNLVPIDFNIRRLQKTEYAVWTSEKLVQPHWVDYPSYSLVGPRKPGLPRPDLSYVQ